MIVIAAINESDLDESVVAEAETLARSFGDELHVVNVRSYDSLDGPESATVTERSVKEAVAGVAEELTDNVNVPSVAVGLIGNPGEEVLEYASSVETRYIVVGESKRTPIGKALFGSRLQKILLGANQPVVTILNA